MQERLVLLLKRNGYVLEQLLSPLVVYRTPEYEELVALASKLVTRHHAHHFLGFAATQWGGFNNLCVSIAMRPGNL